ncbi:MAG: cytochrome c3 family protein, partial [Anaerolineae bacterium]|nr:cytochrome c3 family protein [Anaerolineae bacterium]
PQTAPEATPYGSVFDSASSSVIQFQGEGLPDNAYCMGCHENPSLQMSLTSGETFSVAVNGDEYADSVHGQHGTAGYRCVRCHIDMNAYPHEQVVAESARELSIELSTSCARCHPDKYDETLDDVHVKLMVEGNENAAVCSDCHSAHNVKRLTDEQTGASLPDAHMTSAQMCENCHTQIYEQYSQSVHGSALLTGNTDVPACANCHGTHDTQGPSSDSSFRLFSPQICADCHADEKMMAKYDISTDVFDTYVADFHGTTVTIFQSTAPDQKFNAPVCIDCHGVHDIVHVDNAESPVIKENLVDTCQRCHPDASTNFPSAWLSHYQPSFKRTPLVALANLAYTIAIPGIVGGLGLFVVTDVRRRRADRRKDHHHDA